MFWILAFSPLAIAADITDAEKNDIGRSVTKLFRATRAVISQNQKLINDPNVGDKGLTGEVVTKKAWENYNKSAKKETIDMSLNPLKAEIIKAFEQATNEVMNNAQPLINKRGLGFKRFLPAIFAEVSAYVAVLASD
mgnify:CR=1 FL=1